ncbi:GNAT family N-acetyltransferase [Streptomyces orinoci]|uniref:GNAT family N-acetyltransferase n=1 Tax=Streptomyces orinoci TaxID=67339 RepID=A0ABV3K3R7_STRON|nr:GNAT family N-acetyltransferase [Streptomyces orinoci]
MDPANVLRALDAQLREHACPDGPGARVERVGEVVRQTAPPPGWNGVLWSRLTEATADAAIAAQVRHFATLGRDFEWKLYSHDAPADLADRLQAAGFIPEPPETVMVAEVTAVSTELNLPEGIHLHTVTDPAEVHLVATAHEQAFGTDAARLAHRLREQLARQPEELTLVVAMAGDQPVSAARMELCPGTEFAGLWGGGTAPGWRGRGIYRALITHRARIAAARGYRYLQVDASEESRPILGRLGFMELSTTTPYVYDPGRRAPH